jgi:hypothetical protein
MRAPRSWRAAALFSSFWKITENREFQQNLEDY